MELERPNQYDDVLIKMHNGAWFGFNAIVDVEYTRETGRIVAGVPETETYTVKEERGLEHTYENLVIYPVDGVTHDKPTKEYLDTELAKLQAEWDDFAYGRNRRNEYPPIGEQLDMIYHDQVNGTTTFKDAVKAVKDKYPKS
jgi:hypothetical protein